MPSRRTGSYRLVELNSRWRTFEFRDRPRWGELVDDLGDPFFGGGKVRGGELRPDLELARNSVGWLIAQTPHFSSCIP